MNTQYKTNSDISKALMAFLVIMTLMTAALPALAKEKWREDDDRDNNRGQAKKEVKQDFREIYLNFLRAYFARNFRNGDFRFDGNFRFPFKNNGTTTVDSVTPVINDLRVEATSRNRAVVTWKTNERADSAVFVSSTTPVDIQTISPRSNNGQVFDHQIVLTNLNASTTYYIVVRSRDVAGNVALSGTISFSTNPAKTDNVSPSIANISGAVSASTITVNWKTNENSTSKVFYSTTGTVDVNSSSTAFVEKVALVKDHSLIVPNLASSTTYYLVVESKDAAGNKSVSAVFTFTTSATAVPADTVAPAISNIYGVVGGTTLGINWVTNEPANSKVYYGTTTPINIAASTTASVGDGGFVTSHALSVGSLATSTKYYFVIESKDAAGNTTRSAEYYATTAAN